MSFLRHGQIYQPMSPPKGRRRSRPGSAPTPIGSMSLQLAIPQQVALLQSLPPLHQSASFSRQPAPTVNRHHRRVREFSSSTMRNFQPVLTDAQDPWTLPPSRKRMERPIEGPLPERVQIVCANLLYVEKEGLPPTMLTRLLRLAAFQNPEFYKAQAMRLPTYAKPRVIACGQDFPQYIAVPRGCLRDVLALLQAHNVRPEVRDERFAGTPIAAEFAGQLRPIPRQGSAH